MKDRIFLDPGSAVDLGDCKKTKRRPATTRRRADNLRAQIAIERHLEGLGFAKTEPVVTTLGKRIPNFVSTART